MIAHETSKRKNTPHRVRGGCVLLCVCAVALVMVLYKVINANRDYAHCLNTPFPTLHEVEHYAYFKLPPSAQHLAYEALYENDGSDEDLCTIWVSFDIEPRDLESFQNSTRATFSGSYNPDLIDYRAAQKWTLPESIIVASTQTGDIPLGYQVVYIDVLDIARFFGMLDGTDPHNLAEGTRFKVYITVHEGSLT